MDYEIAKDRGNAHALDYFESMVNALGSEAAKRFHSFHVLEFYCVLAARAESDMKICKLPITYIKTDEKTA